jgi:hypothetical protein
MKTAVEWLVEHLNLDETSPNYNELIINKAKEIEKEQIKFFFKKGHLYSGCPYGLEECYNKTFKSE